jgi:hypothetical protein
MKYFSCILFSFILSSCELIVIGTPKKETRYIDISQRNAFGTILLFKTELDSNNVPAATDVLAKDITKKYLAIDKIEFYDEVNRIGRIISKKNITKYTTDTISKDLYRLNLEFNYRKQISFTTTKIDSSWYIISVN